MNLPGTETEREVTKVLTLIRCSYCISCSLYLLTYVHTATQSLDLEIEYVMTYLFEETFIILYSLYYIQYIILHYTPLQMQGVCPSSKLTALETALTLSW